MDPKEIVAWTGDEFQRMEAQLDIKVPEAYQTFVVQRAHELARLTYPLTYVDTPEANTEESWFEHTFFGFDPEFVTSRNRDFRHSDNLVGHAFPGWWKNVLCFCN